MTVSLSIDDETWSKVN